MEGIPRQGEGGRSPPPTGRLTPTHITGRWPGYITYYVGGHLGHLAGHHANPLTDKASKVAGHLGPVSTPSGHLKCHFFTLQRHRLNPKTALLQRNAMAIHLKIHHCLRVFYRHIFFVFVVVFEVAPLHRWIVAAALRLCATEIWPLWNVENSPPIFAPDCDLL